MQLLGDSQNTLINVECNPETNQVFNIASFENEKVAFIYFRKLNKTYLSCNLTLFAIKLGLRKYLLYQYLRFGMEYTFFIFVKV